jgi:hypothetical protein
MASERLRDRDLTAELRSPKLKAEWITVEEARSRGWDTLRTGELLDAAEAAGFDVFLTT